MLWQYTCPHTNIDMYVFSNIHALILIQTYIRPHTTAGEELRAHGMRHALLYMHYITFSLIVPIKEYLKDTNACARACGPTKKMRSGRWFNLEIYCGVPSSNLKALLN